MDELDMDLLAELEGLGERPPAMVADETLPATVDDYSEKLLLAKKVLAMFEAEAEALKNAVFDLAIRDQAGSAKAAEYKGTAQKIVKKIDAKIKEIIEEPSDYIQAVRNFGANLKAPLSEAKSEADRKLSIWAEYERQERAKQAKLAAAALAKAQAQIDKAAAKKGIESVTLPDAKLPPQKTVIRTDSGTTFEVRKWVGQVVFPEKVDRAYCSPDQKKINEAIAGGMRNPDMAGVDIYEEVKMQTRTR